MDRCTLPPPLAVDPSEPWSDRRARRWVGFFLALGVAARLIRFALRFPLWEDECFLSANFLERGYLDLTGGLDYFQVAPLGFLWVQLTAVKFLGFTEYSLRLVPLLCGLAGLFLFRHLAGRFLKGTALVLAVAMFSVAYPCIRYAAEAKQYGVELFVSLGLLTLAVEWWRRPDRTLWLWGLAALAPVAVWLAYPAAFVGGAISLFVAWTLLTGRRTTPPLSQDGRGAGGEGAPQSHPEAAISPPLTEAGGEGSLPPPRRGWVPWLAFNVLLVGALAALYFLSAQHQAAKSMNTMERAWGDGFPPWTEPLKLLGWLAETHTSELLAYPVGGRRGASAATFVLCAVAVGLLIRRRRWAVLAFWLGPLFVSLTAAALHRYPYGQMAKFQLFAAPTFCMAAGLGAAVLVLRPIGGRTVRPTALRLVLLLLAAIGAGSIGRDFLFPAKSATAARARDFARWFWWTAEYDGEVACLKTDLGQSFGPWTFEWGLSAMYLCNQRIYSPRHARGEPVAWDRVSAQHPLRCVEYWGKEFPYDAAARDRWLREMESRYVLIGREQFVFAKVRDKDPTPQDLDYLDVYKFIPRPQ